MKILGKFGILLMVLLTVACRGDLSDKSPVHLVYDMDSQDKFKAYAENAFFENGSAMQLPVEHTIARGELFEDMAFHTGKDENGSFLLKNPLLPTAKILKRGQQQFEIYCSVCHNHSGDGMGKIKEYKYPPAASFHSDRVLQMPDGQIFSVITNGNVIMPSYAHQITVHDRWAIINYVRDLQRILE